MRKNAFTLIEIVVSIVLLSLITVAFLPATTFGFRNLIGTERFMTVTNDYQLEIENVISEKQSLDPVAPMDTKTIFGKSVTGHVIHEDSDTSGEVFVLVPKKSFTHVIPEMVAPPDIEVQKNDVTLATQPDQYELTDNTMRMFVREVLITNETKSHFLMNVYRWYISPEMPFGTVLTDDTKDYFIVKEWNEARSLVSLTEGYTLGFIPNIKNAYNVLKFTEIQNELSLIDEDFINLYGNRYVRYSVTPYSLAGRIGKEELSDSIYINAPRIVIENATYHPDENVVMIMFEENISSFIDLSKIIMAEEFGNPVSASRDSSDYKVLYLEYDQELDKTLPISGNLLTRGSVQSETHGSISIWYDDQLEGHFEVEALED